MLEIVIIETYPDVNVMPTFKLVHVCREFLQEMINIRKVSTVVCIKGPVQNLYCKRIE